MQTKPIVGVDYNSVVCSEEGTVDPRFFEWAELAVQNLHLVIYNQDQPFAALEAQAKLLMQEYIKWCKQQEHNQNTEKLSIEFWQERPANFAIWKAPAVIIQATESALQ